MNKEIRKLLRELDRKDPSGDPHSIRIFGDGSGRVIRHDNSVVFNFSIEGQAEEKLRDFIENSLEKRMFNLLSDVIDITSCNCPVVCQGTCTHSKAIGLRRELWSAAHES